MLTTPAFTTIRGVTIFPDDEVWHRFYALAPHPTVRRNADGDPIFLLVKYAFSDSDREARPDLPAGGGYLNFDVVFDLEPELEEAVKAELQTWVDAEWQRRRGGGPSAGRSAGRTSLRFQQMRVPSQQVERKIRQAPEPPRVELGTPTWTEGHVALDAPQDENLVSARVAEGSPSLLAGNTAVFSMSLSAAGATFMERTLVDPDGDGGTDLTPLQVNYDLSFWARLPPVHIRIEVDSESVHKHVQKILDDEGRKGCTTYDFDHSTVDTTTAHQAGLINVQIDTGSAELDEDVISELRTYALRLVEEMIENQFFTDQPPEGVSLPDLPDLEEGESQSRRFFRRDYDETTMHIELDLEQSSVVQWKIRPQATLETFFAGMSAEKLRTFVRPLDLADPFFEHLDLEARVFTNFDDPELQAVEIELRYEGRDENGDRQEKTTHLTFTEGTPQRWNPSLIGTSRELSYRYRVSLAGSGFGPFSEPVKTTSSSLNVAIPTPGKLDLEVLAGDIDFEELVESVQVRLAYEDPEAEVELEEHTVVLDASRPSGVYRRHIGAFQSRPVRYRRRFAFRSGDVFEDPDWQEAGGRQLVINQPFTDLLRVALLPAGDGWDAVQQVVIDVRYEDSPNGHRVSQSFMLSNRSELRIWKVALRNPALRSFDYRVTASFKDGSFEQGEWQLDHSQTTVPIVVEAPERLEIHLIPDRMDFQASPVTEVTLTYDSVGIAQSETFIFRDKTPQIWRLPVPEGAPLDYTWAVTFFPVNGPAVSRPPVRERDSVVVLPRFEPPREGAIEIELLGQLIDYAETPLVVVDLFYDDPENSVHEVGSRTFSQKETRSWVFQVPNIAQKSFRARVTYFFADDRPQHVVELPPQVTPRVILQKPQVPVS